MLPGKGTVFLLPYIKNKCFTKILAPVERPVAHKLESKFEFNTKKKYLVQGMTSNGDMIRHLDNHLPKRGNGKEAI